MSVEFGRDDEARVERVPRDCPSPLPTRSRPSASGSAPDAAGSGKGPAQRSAHRAQCLCASAGRPLPAARWRATCSFSRHWPRKRTLQTPLLGSILASNRAHGHWAFNRLRRRWATSRRQRRIAVLGLCYKAGTDAIRRSPAIELFRDLPADGAIVPAFDPAVRNLPSEFSAATMAGDAAGAITGAAAVVLATDGPTSTTLRAEDFSRMQGRLVLDPSRLSAASRSR